MLFSIEWCVPQRILIGSIVGDISSTDAQEIAEQMEAHIQAGTAPVHIIFDMTQMGAFPASVPQLNRMSRWVYHAHTGWIITVNPGRLLSFVGTIVTGMAGVKHKSVASQDEALKLLHKIDNSLPVDVHS